ncbi:outer membrane protein transport protein [Hahella sp. SMD15-11]|uniref:Outer membrane protein transport protein n=1 Tax=Thermohahella caldifontis TaxID=3142973 RepID=A0AB39UU70_9GAMM
MSSVFQRRLLAGSALLLSLPAFSASFQVGEHSAAGIGRANAGEAAIADDASTLATNAAAMTLLDSASVSAVVTYVDPDVTITGQKTSVMPPATLTIDEDGVAPSEWVPSLYYVQPVGERLRVGLSATTYYGLSTDYADSSNLTEFADETEIVTLSLNPNVAYRVTDQLSLGAGISYVKADAKLTTSSTALGKIFGLEGDGDGWGYNLGMLWEFSPMTRLGVSYRSDVHIGFDGDVSMLVGSNTRIDSIGTLSVTLPSQLELSVFHRYDDKLAVHASILKTGWHSFDVLTAHVEGVGPVLVKEEYYDDAVRYSLGATYTLNETVTLRAGWAFDESPVKPEYRSLSIPDSDRVWYSLGASVAVNPQLGVDLGYAYVDGDSVTLSNTSSLGTTFTGNSEGNGHLFSAQVNYRF